MGKKVILVKPSSAAAERCSTVSSMQNKTLYLSFFFAFFIFFCWHFMNLPFVPYEVDNLYVGIIT